MKTWVIAIAAAVLFAAHGRAEELRVGDHAEAVYRELGQPRGRTSFGDRTVLLYRRGKVVLQDNIVTRVKLVSEEAADAREREEAQRKKEQITAQKAAAERNLEEGLSLKEQKLADPAFAGLSARERLAFWKAFQNQYPGVPVETEVALATEARKQELEQEQLREKAARYEAIAEMAQKETEKAQEETRNKNNRSIHQYSRTRYYRYPYPRPYRNLSWKREPICITTRVTPVKPITTYSKDALIKTYRKEDLIDDLSTIAHPHSGAFRPPVKQTWTTREAYSNTVCTQAPFIGTDVRVEGTLSL
jgi:hypothetical protein